jgi:bifunctional DNA-binding transcriptional regulator/antitoxin component of YhaV-PrlF toxin-antitoxin module
MPAMLERPVEATTRLRRKNQLTLPEPIALILEANTDDILVFEADPERPGTVVVHRVGRSFAGALTGVFGPTAQVLDYQEEEHADWAE